jgi:protocatechuate 3,4-dioxygenase beta subunit
VTTGDFNGDGKLDLAVANEMSNTVSILLGNGDGTFQTAVNYDVGSYPRSVTAGDFNGDGKLDLAVANYFSSNVSILLGNDDGTFQTAVNYSAGTNPSSVTTGDFNGDGKLDLAVANSGGNTVSILLGNGDGTFQTAMNYGVGTNPFSVTTGDFNGDGKLDLAVANSGGNTVSILLGNGDGTFQTAVSYGVGSYPYIVTTGDFNGDGKLDLAVTNGSSNNVSILLNTMLRIVTSPGGHGSISCSPVQVDPGQSSSCTIIADAGYKISNVLVNGSSVGAVGSYTLGNITADMTIAAAFDLNASAVTITQTVVNTSGVPVAGAQVSVVGSPSYSAITDANGTFVLPVPYGVTFSYSISKTGYRDFYSNNFNLTSSTVMPNRTIYTDADVTAWGVMPGYGALSGRAVDAATGQTINNPTVTAASTLNPGTFYTVQYSSVCNTGTGTCTYKVINVAANDAVLLTVSAPGYVTLQMQLNPLPADAVGNAYVTLTQAVNPSVAYGLSLTMTGTGTGTITSSPGYNCSGTCRQEYNSGVMVSLDAAAAAGSTFSGWTGCDSVNGATCTVSMTSARSVSANFTRLSLGTGTVYGRITDSSGAGVANALVRVVREYDSASCSGPSCMNVLTDSFGNYLIGNIVPGTYIGAFYNEPVQFGTSGGSVYTTNQYYSSKHSMASADLVTVSEGSSTQIDAVFPPFGQISGTVTDTNGAGIGNINVRVFNLDEEYMDQAWTDSFGRYTLQHVPSGTYKIRFQANIPSSLIAAQNLMTQVAYVTVTATDSITGINTILSPGRRISGRLTNRDGLPIAGSVTVFDLRGNNIASATADATGAYTAMGIPPGSYKVVFYASSLTGGIVDAAKLYSQQVYGGDPYAAGVTVTADADVSNIDGVLEVSGPVLSVSAFKEFGVEIVGMSSYRSFQLTNRGTADLALGTLSKTGADFIILSDRCSGVTLAPTKICTFQVAFIPQSEGSKAGAINIPSNDPDMPVYTISLMGSGGAATGNSGTTAVQYGDNVAAAPTTEVALSFTSVTSAEATVTATAVTTLASPAPSNFRMLNGASYDISTTAAFTGPITVCINYDPATISNPTNEQNLKLFHFNGAAWQDITTSVDTAAKKICGATASLSPFAIAEPTGNPTYTITASAGSHGTISPSGDVLVVAGTTQGFTITPDAGYVVASRVVDGVTNSGATSYTFSNVQTAHTISAGFNPTITSSAGANGTISPSGTNSVASGGGKTYTISPATGYHVADVLVDGVSVGAVTSYSFNSVTTPHTIDATFSAI